MSLKQDIRTILLQQSWLSSTEIARRLGKDRNNVRKAAQELEAAGELRSENDGGTFRFYLDGAAQAPALTAVAKSAISVIDATYKDVTEPSNSRALVPVEQPYDSRTEAALAQHARARRLRSAQGQAMGQGIIAALNQGYLDDPTGDLTLAAAAQAEAAAEREKLVQERAEAAMALAARPREPTTGELLSAFGLHAVKVWGAMQDRAREQAREEWEARQSAPVSVGFVEEEDRFKRTQRERSEEAERSAPARPSSIERLLAKARTRTIPGAEAQPPASGAIWEWWRRRFSTPSKPTWR